MDSIPLGYSIESKEADEDSLSEVLNEFIAEWDVSPHGCIFFTTSFGESLIKRNIIDQGWHICAPSNFSPCLLYFFSSIMSVASIA